MSILKDYNVGSLLTAPNANPKVAKNDKLNIHTAVLHLAPASLSGYNACPSASKGCEAACLHFAGSPAYYTNKTKARIARTKAYFERRAEFMDQLAKEIESHVRRCKKVGMNPAVRLNGTSDIPFDRIPYKDKANIMAAFPDVQFYDYTAIFREIRAPNYHLTFSLKEDNHEKARRAADAGWPVAVVFGGKSLPDTYMGLPVIDGDIHDYRPADPKGCIVGLKAKGTKGKADTSGFVVQI